MKKRKEIKKKIKRSSLFRRKNKIRCFISLTSSIVFKRKFVDLIKISIQRTVFLSFQFIFLIQILLDTEEEIYLVNPYSCQIILFF